MNWNLRYKAMKKGLGYTNSDIAKIIGNTADSVKSVTQPNGELPRWLRLAIVIFERTGHVESLYEQALKMAELKQKQKFYYKLDKKLAPMTDSGWLKLDAYALEVSGKLSESSKELFEYMTELNCTMSEFDDVIWE